jgi:hypothetical protein
MFSNSKREPHWRCGPPLSIRLNTVLVTTKSPSSRVDQVGGQIGANAIQNTASKQFVQFLDDKLKKHSIKKVVPQADELANAYSLFVRNAKVEAVIEEAIDNLDDDGEEIEVPKDLERQVLKYLEDHPTARWDEAVQNIADGGDGDGDGDGGGDDEPPSPTPAPPLPKQVLGVWTEFKRK